MHRRRWKDASPSLGASWPGAERPAPPHLVDMRSSRTTPVLGIANSKSLTVQVASNSAEATSKQLRADTLNAGEAAHRVAEPDEAAGTWDGA